MFFVIKYLNRQWLIITFVTCFRTQNETQPTFLIDRDQIIYGSPRDTKNFLYYVIWHFSSLCEQ